MADVSNYDFINSVSDVVLGRVSIDGGMYMLPINYSIYGIFYNKTWMNEKGWDVPANFAELEAMCNDLRAEGVEPGYVGTWLVGGPFHVFFNLAKTDWLATPDGARWEQDFLSGNATASGKWDSTMDYIQRYIDIGMFNIDPDDRNNDAILEDKAQYAPSCKTTLQSRKAFLLMEIHGSNIII